MRLAVDADKEKNTPVNKKGFRRNSIFFGLCAVASLAAGIGVVTSWRGAACTLGIVSCLGFIVKALDSAVQEDEELKHTRAIEAKEAEYRAKAEYEQRVMEMRRQEREELQASRVR